MLTEAEFVHQVMDDTRFEDSHYVIVHNEDHIIDKSQDVLGAVIIVPVEGNVYVLTKG